MARRSGPARGVSAPSPKRGILNYVQYQRGRSTSKTCDTKLCSSLSEGGGKASEGQHVVAGKGERGDGPPFIKIGRAIRYSEAALIQWMKGRQRLSTSEQ